jgi:hypothetical protein
VVFGEQVGHLLIELAEVILNHAQFFQRELQQPTVDGMQRRTYLEGIAQLGRCGSQTRGRKCRESSRIRFTICSIRRALMPRRSDTTLDTLTCASSSSAFSRL